MKRVLLVVGLCGFGALVAATVLSPDAVIGLALLCLIAGILGFCLPTVRTRSCAYGAGLLAAAMALCLFAQKELSDYRPVVAHAGQTVWMKATVIDTPIVSNEQLFCEVRVSEGDLKAGTRLIFGMPWDDEPPAVGDTVTGTVWLGVSESMTTDPIHYLGDKASGVYLTAWQSRDGAVIIRPSDLGAERSLGETMTAHLRAFREAARARLTAALPKDVRALVSAVCLGDRSGLDDATTSAFRRSGISHLLVVSGLHVSLVSMGLYSLLRRLRCKRRAAALLALIGLLLFGCLIGWRASVVRACVLTGAVLLGHCFRRPADSLNSLGGGLLVLWLHDPFCVYDLGLWMSFGATVGLICLYPWLWKRVSDKWFQKPAKPRASSVGLACIRRVTQAVCITLAATLPTMPLVACFFGEISLISPLTNLLAVWAAAAILYLACATFICSGAGLSALAPVLAIPITALSRYLLWITRILSGWGGAVWHTNTLYKQMWIVGGLLLLWLGWRLCRGRGLRVAAAICVIVLCAGTLLYTVRMQGVTTLTAYNRYGYTTVVAQRDGRAIVIVSGRAQSWNTAARLLDEQNLTAVDAVILTDPNNLPADEWAAFDARIKVGRYWLTEFEPDTAARLLTGRAPVSVVSFTDDQSVSFWQDGEWRFVRETNILLLRFGNTWVRIGAPDLWAEPADADGAQSLLSLTVSARTNWPRGDDTPVPGQRHVWYTRGQGAWVK